MLAGPQSGQLIASDDDRDEPAERHTASAQLLIDERASEDNGRTVIAARYGG
jgi:hypothetical protein